MVKRGKRSSKIYLRDGRAPIPENETTSEVMSAIRAKDTKPEIILRKALREANLSGYRLHWEKAPGRPDICYPGRKVAVFVHGCYWHRCPHCKPRIPKTHTDFWEAKFARNAARDNSKITMLKHDHWNVVVCWECQIKDSIHECVKNISDLLEEVSEGSNR
jgi:DNA mismatch endonuclease (patch repair protein)